MMVYLTPTLPNLSARGIDQLIMEHVTQLRGCLEEVVCGRDTQFALLESGHVTLRYQGKDVLFLGMMGKYRGSIALFSRVRVCP